MATTIIYQASTAATITLTTLANGSGQECTAIINTAGSAIDAACMITLKTTTGTHGSDLACYVHFYGSPDGTAFPNPVTGTNAAVTINTGMNLNGPVPIIFGTSTTGLATAKKYIGSVAALFGGVLPSRYGLVIENKTNLAFTNTAGDHAVVFYPISDTQ